MSGYQELESRVTALEERLDEQAGLRASQDRDLSNVSEALRAQLTMIQALAVTQSQHTYQIGQLDLKVDRLDNKVTRLDHKMDQKFAQVDRKFAQVDQRLDKVDQRFDKVDQRLDKLDHKVGQLDGKLDRVTEDVQLIISMLGRPAGGDSPV